MRLFCGGAVSVFHVVIALCRNGNAKLVVIRARKTAAHGT